MKTQAPDFLIPFGSLTSCKKSFITKRALLGLLTIWNKNICVSTVFVLTLTCQDLKEQPEWGFDVHCGDCVYVAESVPLGL